MNWTRTTLLEVLALFLAMSGPAAIAEDAKTSPADPGKEAIYPLIADKFGKVIVVEGEFVEKRKSYHDQNMVNEPYLFKVLAVDGKKLKTPVTIEYVVVGSDERSERTERGVKFRMRAYETLYTEGSPENWDPCPAQVNYHLIHRLIIRDLSKVS